MIRVFSPSDTIFTSNGNKVLRPISCTETKVVGEEWYIEVKLGLEYVSFIAQDSIVVLTTKYGEQPFRILNILVGNTIEFRANHIGYDTQNYIVDTLTVTGTASAMLTALVGTSTNDFTVYSDIAGSKTLTFAQCTLYEAIIALQDAFGGFLDFDGWQIRLTATLGADRGVVVEYGKNLEEAEVTEDWSMVCTTIYPIGIDGITLTPKTLTSSTTYDKPYQKVVDFDTADLTVLNNLALAYLSRFDKPKINYTVRSTLQNVYINDTIQVNARQYSILANVLAYTYNSLTGLNESVEFGNYRRTVRGAFSAIRDTMDAIDQKVIAVGDITQQQTELINSAGTFGYCTKTENEMYFHDTIPLASATNVLRMNVAGIGFSTTGVAGPYSTAWTIDGKFNADFIKSGTVDVARIRGDLLDISANSGLKIAIGSNTNNFIPYMQNDFEQGTLNDTGAVQASTAALRMKNYVSIIPSKTYTLTLSQGLHPTLCRIYFYTSANAFISYTAFALTPTSVTAPSNAAYFKVRIYKPDLSTFVVTELGNHSVGVTIGGLISSGSKYFFDGTNATFFNGGLLIKNNAGTTVFTADTNGDLVISGNATFGGNVNTGYDATIGVSLNMPVYTPTGTTDRVNILNNGSKGIRYGAATNKNAFITVVDNQYIISGTTGVVANEDLQMRVYSDYALELVSPNEIRLGLGGTVLKINAVATQIVFAGVNYALSRDSNGFVKATAV